jgi:phage tail sheath gpL-like
MPGFSQIPLTLRVPGAFAEVDPVVAQQGPGVFLFRTLLIAPGSATPGVVEPIKSALQAVEIFGSRSPAAQMAEAYFDAGASVPLDIIGVHTPGGVGNTFASTTCVVSGTIATPGTVFMYIAGTRFEVMASVDAATTAAALHLAIAECAGCLPVNASVVGASLTIEASFRGTAGNALDVRFNHLPGERFPGALSITSPPMTGGLGDPVYSEPVKNDVFAAIAGTRYDIVVHSIAAAPQMDEIAVEMESRADALVGFPGMSFVGFSGTHAALVALTGSRNNKFECVIGQEDQTDWAPVRAAAVAGQAAKFLQDDPVRPLTGRKLLPGFGPNSADEFTAAERDLLLHDGISTIRYDSQNRPNIERLITTYQETTGGSPDEAFLDVQTAFGLSYLRRSYTANFERQFATHKLADDGTVVGPGSVTVTPEIAKTDAVAWYGGMIRAGVAEDLAGFIENTTFERHASDPNRLEGFLAVNLQNQLRVSASLLQFQR